MRQLISIVRIKVLEKNMFRANVIISLFGNLIYMLVIYYLWMAIYDGNSEFISGMSFRHTFLYLSITNTLFLLFQMHTVWYMSDCLVDGRIVHDLLKPINYMLYVFLYLTGNVVSSFIYIFIPSFLVLVFVFGFYELLSMKLVFFFFSLLISFVINFLIDFCVGNLCFYTESTWGINIIKDAIISMFSGVIIPIPLLPDFLQNIVGYMPFQAIYNLPVQILLDEKVYIDNYLIKIEIQIIWLVILLLVSKFITNRTMKMITINGG